MGLCVVLCCFRVTIYRIIFLFQITDFQGRVDGFLQWVQNGSPGVSKNGNPSFIMNRIYSQFMWIHWFSNCNIVIRSKKWSARTPTYLKACKGEIWVSAGCSWLDNRPLAMLHWLLISRSTQGLHTENSMVFLENIESNHC